MLLVHIVPVHLVEVFQIASVHPGCMFHMHHANVMLTFLILLHTQVVTFHVCPVDFSYVTSPPGVDVSHSSCPACAHFYAGS